MTECVDVPDQSVGRILAKRCSEHAPDREATTTLCADETPDRRRFVGHRPGAEQTQNVLCLKAIVVHGTIQDACDKIQQPSEVTTDPYTNPRP